MKKVVIIILLLLPFALSIMISLTGKIISLTTYIAVERIAFVDEYDSEIDSTVIINVGEEYDLNVKVFPSLATNKKISFKLSDEYVSICSINEGVVTGLSHGYAEIVAISDYSKSFTCRLLIKVSDEEIRSISLSDSTLSLSIGENYTLVPTITPSTAKNKLLAYISSDPQSVSVSSNGVISVLKYSERPVTITARSVENPNITATCLITINSNSVASLIFTPILAGQSLYSMSSNSINLFDILSYNTELMSPEEISFTITANARIAGATINGSILSVANENKIFKVRATYGNLISEINIILAESS